MEQKNSVFKRTIFLKLSFLNDNDRKLKFIDEKLNLHRFNHKVIQFDITRGPMPSEKELFHQ